MMPAPPAATARDGNLKPSGVLSNTGWSLADQGMRAALGAAVVIVLSRSLGPRDFGTLGYALAFVKIFSVLAALGLDRVVIRHLVVEPAERAPALLRLVLRLRLAAGAVAYVLLLAILYRWPSSDPRVFSLVAAAAVGLFFQPFDVMDLFFQAHASIRSSVLGKTSAFMLGALLKLVAAMLGAPLLVFAVCDALEPAVAALGLTAVFGWRMRGKPFWAQSARVPVAEFRMLLRQGGALLVASLAVIIYTRIDQIMLGALAGPREVGIYAATCQLSEVWAALPMALLPAWFPFILRCRAQGAAIYRQRLEWLFGAMTLTAYAIAVMLTLAAPLLVRWVFGAAYVDAAPVLRVHAWSLLFVFLGLAQGAWDVSEGLVWLSSLRTALGAVLNIGLNFVLIPRHGALGAAWATVISYGFSAPLLLAFSARTRGVFFLQLRALAMVPLARSLTALDRRPLREWLIARRRGVSNRG